MEGQYYYNEGILNNTTRNMLYNEKENLKILALSKVNNNELMWAHYAYRHKGIAIGVRIDNNLNDVEDIIYNGILEVNKTN
jgi:hypothetical protein